MGPAGDSRTARPRPPSTAPSWRGFACHRFAANSGSAKRCQNRPCRCAQEGPSASAATTRAAFARSHSDGLPQRFREPGVAFHQHRLARPRDSASEPSAPLPANRSSTRVRSMGCQPVEQGFRARGRSSGAIRPGSRDRQAAAPAPADDANGTDASWVNSGCRAMKPGNLAVAQRPILVVAEPSGPSTGCFDSYLKRRNSIFVTTLDLRDKVHKRMPLITFIIDWTTRTGLRAPCGLRKSPATVPRMAQARAFPAD